MRYPNFKTEKIRKDIFELIDQAPFRDMYEIVLKSIDYAMNDLVDVREDIPETDKSRKALEDYDKHFAAFGEREAYYYQAFIDAEDRSVVDAPLFKGDYSGFDFSGPGWPDIETPWRLANELSKAAARAGMGQDFLDELNQRFQNTITEFWTEATRLIENQKLLAEEEASGTQPSASNANGGRRYGFWPYVAMGAVAVVGVLGAAAGYSTAKSKQPQQYVEESFWGKRSSEAKNLGLGFAVGVAAAALLILRVNK